MTLFISCRAELEDAIAHPHDLLSASQIWLSDFGHDHKFTGGYAAAENIMGDGCDMPSVTTIWRSAIEVLARRQAPIKILGLHSTALQMINHNRFQRGQGGILDRHHKWLQENARLVSVENLILSGQCSEEWFWHHLNVTRTITIRGCIHAPRACFWSHLAEGDFTASEVIVVLSSASKVTERDIKHLIGRVARLQRRLVLSGPDNVPFSKFTIQAPLEREACNRLQRFWEYGIPEEYRLGKLVVTPSPRQPSPLSVAEQERRMFSVGSAVSPRSTSGQTPSLTLSGSTAESSNFSDESATAIEVTPLQPFDAATNSPPVPMPTPTTQYMQPQAQQSQPSASLDVTRCGCTGYHNDTTFPDEFEAPSSSPGLSIDDCWGEYQLELRLYVILESALL